ncbi:MAG: NAD-dependent epimerase/dehydratase family protein [Patescibacteria group bacterium]
MNKVVVTGGAGFIGSHLVHALVEKGFNVHIIDDLSGGKKENIHPDATFHHLSIIDKTGVTAVISGADYVFHLAAVPSIQESLEHPDRTHDINVTGMLNVLIASHEAKVKKVIYSGSSAAYGDQAVLPWEESMIPQPKSPYGLHKYIGEEYCKVWSMVYQLPTVSFRYFNVYGPRQSAGGAYPSVIAHFIKLKKEGKPLTITGSGEQTRDFTHVYDVVRANILAMENNNIGKGEVINIGTGKNHTINMFAQLIGGDIVYVPARLEAQNSRADATKAKKLLNWEPQISLEQGIAELKSIENIV